MTVLLDGVSVFIDNWRFVTGMLGFVVIVALPMVVRFKSDPRPASATAGMFLLLFFAISLLLRLAYVSKALFPPYFDSAQHYALVKHIMATDLSRVIDMLRIDYYHLGFHYLVAFFASKFQFEITTTMLVLGQFMLALLPLPIFFIVNHMTRSNWAGMPAVILSAFGWYMPAHAVDWGKYPALMSLGMISFVLSPAYIFVQNKDRLHTRKRPIFSAVLGAGILLTAFVHSRSIIVFGIVAIAWIVSAWREKIPRMYRHLVFLLLIIVVILEVVVIQMSDTLSLLFDPYLNDGLMITALILLLSIFAYRSHSQVTFVCFLTIGLLLVSLYIPVGLMPGRDYLTLMDRPYVEVILFMPLSLLGALGLAGLERGIGHVYGGFATLLCVGLVLFHVIPSYEFYPSDCCAIVGNDDVAAIAWMEEQLPVDARIGISSTELKVIELDVSEGFVGTDAGIWITPLINRVTVLLPYDSDFDQQPALDVFCRRDIRYIFVGELGQSFDIAQFISRPAWYRPLLTMPRTGVYEVIGCDGV